MLISGAEDAQRATRYKGRTDKIIWEVTSRSFLDMLLTQDMLGQEGDIKGEREVL